MTFFNYLVLVVVCGIYVSFSVTLAEGENETNDQNDTVTVKYQFFNVSDNDERTWIREAYVKEFNLILSNKSERIKYLEKKIAQEDDVIRSNNNQDESLQNDETTEKLPPSGLKDCVKKRIRTVFEKELNDIIHEKDVQIYLLEKLLQEKKKTIALQKELREKTINGTTTHLSFGVGEPSDEK